MAPDKMPPDKPSNDVPGSARGYQSDEPFPFLDLPKDIRLMVYEKLPTKVTHYHGDYGLTLVYRTIPGISILATCRQISDEASAILEPRLSIFKSKPVQLISSLWLYVGVGAFLNCLSASEVNCPTSKDLRKLFQVVKYYHFDDEEFIGHDKHTNIRNAQPRQVCIAVNHPRELSDGPLESAWDHLLEIHNIRIMVDGEQDPKPAWDLTVNFRRVLITPEAKEEYAEIDVFRPDPVLVRRHDGITSPLLSEGAVIEEAEWDQDWAEGER